MQASVVQTMGQTQNHTNMGKMEIVTRVICTLFCVGVLMAAAITLPAIKEVENTANEYGIEYEDAASYRGATGCLMFVGSVAILYHVIAIIIRILYINSVVEKYFNLYVYTSAVLCVFFILSLLSGGIANSIFAAQNGKLWNDNCLHTSLHRSPFCQNLQGVTDSEAASAAMSFLSVFLFGILFLIMIGGHLAKLYKSNSPQESACPSPDGPPPYDSLHPPSYESALTMSYAPMDTPMDASLYQPEADSA